MIEKAKLRARLDNMLLLPDNWDGFGTGPICSKVHRIGRDLLDLLPDSLFGLKIFVGINNEGSLFLEFDLNRKLIEMTILDDGTIFYDEVVADTLIGSGSFILTKEHIESLLTE